MNGFIAGKHLSEVLDEIVTRCDCGYQAVARRMGIKAETFWSWLHGKSSMRYDTLADLARRPVNNITGVTDDELVLLLDRLAAGRVVIEKKDLTMPATRTKLIDVYHAASRGCSDVHAVMEDVVTRIADGKVCREDAHSVKQRCQAAIDSLKRVIEVTENCARN